MKPMRQAVVNGGGTVVSRLKGSGDGLGRSRRIGLSGGLGRAGLERESRDQQKYCVRNGQSDEKMQLHKALLITASVSIVHTGPSASCGAACKIAWRGATINRAQVQMPG